MAFRLPAYQNYAPTTTFWRPQKAMLTKIESNPGHSMLTVHLALGEAIKAEPGTMVAQAGIKMTTGAASKNILRTLGRQSSLVNTLRAGSDSGWVSLVPRSPGGIDLQELQEGQSLFIRNKAFLASTENISVHSKFQGMRRFLSEEGMYFICAQAESGPGTIWFSAYGAIQEIQVEPSDELIINTGHLVAFTGGVDYTVRNINSIRSLLVGGGGIVLSLTGTGRAWIQTRKVGSV